jgi:excisionase family DNA binding protein
LTTVSEIIAALAALPPSDMPKIVAAAAAHWADAQPASDPPLEVSDTDDSQLTIEEAAQLLRRSTKWLYRHKKQLTFIRKIGPRSYLISKSALIRWRDRQHV